MTPAVWGLVRAGAAVLAGLGLTYAAMQVPWTTSLSPATSGAAAATATVAPVATNVLICPGPESEGLQGVPPIGGTTTVLAASPPAQVMEGIDVSGTSGNLTVTAEPAQTAVGIHRGAREAGPGSADRSLRRPGRRWWRARCGPRRPADHRRDRG